MVNQLPPHSNTCTDPERCETCANWEVAPASAYTLRTGEVITIPEGMRCIPHGIRVNKCWRNCPLWAPQ